MVPAWDKFRIADRLKQTYPDARLILVLRNQLDYIVSLYMFRLCSRELEYRSLGAYLADLYDRGLESKLLYNLLISHYLDLFGRDNVLILTYEALRRDHIGFAAELCAFMGQMVPAELDTRPTNVSGRSVHVASLNRVANLPLAMALHTPRALGLVSKPTYRRWVNYYSRCKGPLNGALGRWLAAGAKRGDP